MALVSAIPSGLSPRQHEDRADGSDSRAEARDRSRWFSLLLLSRWAPQSSPRREGSEAPGKGSMDDNERRAGPPNPRAREKLATASADTTTVRTRVGLRR